MRALPEHLYFYFETTAGRQSGGADYSKPLDSIKFHPMVFYYTVKDFFMEYMIPNPSYVYDSVSGYLLHYDDFVLIESFRFQKKLYLQYLKIRKKRKFKNK